MTDEFNDYDLEWEDGVLHLVIDTKEPVIVAVYDLIGWLKEQGAFGAVGIELIKKGEQKDEQ